MKTRATNPIPQMIIKILENLGRKLTDLSLRVLSSDLVFAEEKL